MNETIDSYTNLIKNHARVALKKMKKPLNCDIEDLTQEGTIVFLNVKEVYEEDRGCSFKSFLTRCLRQHFGDLVSRSYRSKETTGVELGNKLLIETSKISHNAFDIVSTRFIIDDFSFDELEYVKMIFSFINISTKYRRKLVRKTLKISYDREMELRRSIHDKIRK